MRLTPQLPLITFLLLSGTPGSLTAQAAVQGVVIEEVTNQPVAGALVALERTDREVRTDQTGHFLLTDLPTGERTLLVRSIGHVPLRVQVTLSQGDTTRVDVRLTVAPQQLDSILVEEREPARVNPRLVEFEERRRMGFGFQIDSTELRRMEGRRFSEVLRTATGLRIIQFRERNQSGRVVPRTEYRAASSRRTGMGEGEYCFTSVYIDGSPIFRSGGLSGQHFGDPPDFSRDFQIANFDAVEVYINPAQVPIQFGGRTAECGVILLWTRRGR